MNEQIKVNLDFINKKGIKKHVKFYMNKQTYDSLYSKEISEEERHRYLVEEYHEYEKERYYQRKHSSFDIEFAESIGLLENNYFNEEINPINEEINNAISKLNKRQQEMVRLIYWEGKSQKDLCKIYGVKKQAISDAMKRIHNNLKKSLEKNKNF